MQEIFNLDDFDIVEVLGELESKGAASSPVLNEGFRKCLLKEALSYDYRHEEEIVGSGDKVVRQQIESFENFGPESKYILLKRQFQKLLEGMLRDLEAYPFGIPLNLNTMVLQKYRKGSIGITPHRDGLKYINLVCIFVIGGKGKFFVCAERSGSEAIEIPHRPGSVIFLKAPGFMGSDERPFHFVTDIEETRYTFGLRQMKDAEFPMEQIKNVA
jgi:hypothetical protein